MAPDARRRVLLGSALVAAAALVVAAVLIVTGDADRPTAKRKAGPKLISIAAPGVSGVAVAGDALWTAREVDTAAGGTVQAAWVLERRDAATGDVIATVRMPGVVRGVVATDDVVAAFGGGDGAEPQGGVAIVDPAHSRIIATYGWEAGPAVAPYRAVATREAVWVTDTAGHLLEFRTGGAPAAPRRWDVDGQPTDLAALEDGSVWVWRSEKQLLSRFDPAAGAVTTSHSWCCGLLAADGRGIWTSDGERLVELRPDLLGEGLSVAEGTRLPVAASAVVADGDGLWVATRDRSVQRWSREHGAEARPAPETTKDTDRDLAPWALAGHRDAVWFVTIGGLARWQPNG
jgi:hypothetical protein